MAKENRPKGASLRKRIFEHSLNPKGYIDKAMKKQGNTAKPVKNEHRHAFLPRGCADKGLASEGCIAKEFPLSVYPFPLTELEPKGYIDKGAS